MLSTSEAARALGSVRTERKAKSSAMNGRLYGGVPLLPLHAIPCNCGGEGLDHRSTCRRGRTIRRRQRLGQRAL